MATKSTLKRPVHKMPAFMRKALTEAGLMDLYKERPPYQQNDYVFWISSPKTEPTKLKRLNQMLAELRKGDVYMNMAWRKGKD